MTRYCWTAYSVFFVSVVLATATADRSMSDCFAEPLQGSLQRCSRRYFHRRRGPLLQAAGMTRKEFKFPCKIFIIWCLLFSENLKKYGTKRTYPSKCFNILSIYMYKYLQNVKTTRFMVWRPCEQAWAPLRRLRLCLVLRNFDSWGAVVRYQSGTSTCIFASNETFFEPNSWFAAPLLVDSVVLEWQHQG